MICRVSASEGGSTRMVWNLRSRAPSFSMYLRYSSRVVAPMHWNSPRDRAGLKMLDASREPSDPPAPTMVCSSSMKMMTFSFFWSSVMRLLRRSSNWPRYLVPATMEPMSRVTTRLFSRISGMLRSTIFWARPSTMAVLPTPGSPMSTGLFFLRRDRIWMTRSISGPRPIIGSSWPWRASSVRSRPKWSRKGVLLFLRLPAKSPGAGGAGASPPRSTRSISSFTRSYSTPMLARALAAALS